MLLRARLRPLVLVLVAAVFVSAVPSTLWAADPTLPPGWLDKAIKRHAVVTDSAAKARFTAMQGDDRQMGRSRRSKVLLGIGIGLAAAGGVMVAAGGEPTEIGESGVGIDWRTTGYIWLGTGAVLAIWGLASK